MDKKIKNILDYVYCNIKKLIDRVDDLESNSSTSVISIDTIEVNEGVFTINYTDTEGSKMVTTVLPDSTPFHIQYNVNQFNDLSSIVSPDLYSYAYVRLPQGIKWVNYKGSGLYMWDGVNWVEDDTDIFQQLQDILNSLSNKLDNRDTEISVKNLAELLAIHPANLNNEIQLDSKNYKFDSDNFDLTGYTLIGNPQGTTLSGFTQNINKISSSEDSISLIKSTGNLFIKHLEIEVTGLNSECISMVGATSFESLDMFYVSFINCTKLGTLSNLRQGFWSTGFSIGCLEGFTLQGNWGGGFTLQNSRIINMGNFILKGDSGFTCTNIRSNVNATIPLGAVGFDFNYNHFNIDSGYQLENGTYNGDGEMVSSFSGGDTTLTENSRKSFFKNNKGTKGRNTFQGTEWECTTEVLTPLTLNVLTKLEGVTTYKNEIHFNNVGNNSIRYNSMVNANYDIIGSIYLVGGANDILDLYVRRYNVITSLYEELKIVRRKVVALAGSDVAEFNFFTSSFLNEGDLIEIWIVNLTDNSDVTMVNTSSVKVRKT